MKDRHPRYLEGEEARFFLELHKSDPKFAKEMAELTEQEWNLRRGRNPFMAELAKRSLEYTQIKHAEASGGFVTYEGGNDSMKALTNLVTVAKKSIQSVINCTSSSAWNNSEWGQYYQMQNIFQARTIPVENIFVFQNNQQFLEAKEGMVEQVSRGVKVWIAPIKTSLIEEHSYLLFDKQCAAKIYLNKGEIAKTEVFIDSTDLSTAQGVFDYSKKGSRLVNTPEDLGKVLESQKA